MAKRIRWRAGAAMLCGSVLTAVMVSSAMASEYELPATSKTVAWGHYDFDGKPVLRVRSGDTVVVHTLLTSSPTALERAGVAPADVEPALREVFAGVTDRGPGGHVLTGPIAVEGAEPGDTLEIRILKIDLAIPYAYNGFRSRRSLPRSATETATLAVPTSNTVRKCMSCAASASCATSRTSRVSP